MSAIQCVDDIILALKGLPIEKLVEVKNFVVSLKDGDTRVPDEYSWTEEELREFSALVMDHANKTIPWEE